MRPYARIAAAKRPAWLKNNAVLVGFCPSCALEGEEPAEPAEIDVPPLSGIAMPEGKPASHGLPSPEEGGRGGHPTHSASQDRQLSIMSDCARLFGERNHSLAAAILVTARRRLTLLVEAASKSHLSVAKVLKCIL